MSKIKLPNGGILSAWCSGAAGAKGELQTPCDGADSVECNGSTQAIAAAMGLCGSNFMSIYRGAKCPHNLPAINAAPTMAYILDNYVSAGDKPIKMRFDQSVVSLLNGTVAICYFEGLWGSGAGGFDIWNNHNLVLKTGGIREIEARRIWVWALGNAPQLKAKHSHHKSSHKVTVF